MGRTEDQAETRKVENARLRVELAGLREQNDGLNRQRAQVTEDLHNMRDRNGADYIEIDKLTQTHEMRVRESSDLNQRIKGLEYDLQKSL